MSAGRVQAGVGPGAGTKGISSQAAGATSEGALGGGPQTLATLPVLHSAAGGAVAGRGEWVAEKPRSALPPSLVPLSVVCP